MVMTNVFEQREHILIGQLNACWDCSVNGKRFFIRVSRVSEDTLANSRVVFALPEYQGQVLIAPKAKNWFSCVKDPDESICVRI